MKAKQKLGSMGVGASTERDEKIVIDSALVDSALVDSTKADEDVSFPKAYDISDRFGNNWVKDANVGTAREFFDSIDTKLETADLDSEEEDDEEDDDEEDDEEEEDGEEGDERGNERGNQDDKDQTDREIDSYAWAFSMLLPDRINKIKKRELEWKAPSGPG
jgi:hypothetical protein